MSSTFRVTVNHDLAPIDMMKAAGCKEGIFSTKLFSNRSGVEEIEIILMKSPVRATPAMVRATMRSLNRRGCDVAELLALVAFFRETLGSDKIVALGSWDSLEDGTQGFPTFHTPYFEMLYDVKLDYSQMTQNQLFFSPRPGWNESYLYASTPKTS